VGTKIFHQLAFKHVAVFVQRSWTVDQHWFARVTSIIYLSCCCSQFPLIASVLLCWLSLTLLSGETFEPLAIHIDMPEPPSLYITTEKQG